MKKILAILVVFLMLAVAFPVGTASASTCTPTGYVRDSINMTAALINPTSVNGTVDAAGCNIGVYFDSGSGSVDGADIFGANYFGVVNNGAKVDISNSDIHDIGETPLNGSQHGIGIYFVYDSTSSGKITNNHIWNYQKGGITVNSAGARVLIKGNLVEGQGPVSYIAQNGIQVGYGATANVMNNTVTGNSYTGISTVSGGILVVGGPCYGGDYSTDVQIQGNVLANNDIGVFLSNLGDACGAPDAATNIKVVNNVISSDGLYNNYGSFGYQAGISDVGNNDKLIHNNISGAGYDPDTYPSAYVVAIDADASYAIDAKVHANVINP